MRIPARATARAICTSPSHNRTIATVKMTAPTVSRAIRTSRAAPAVGLGAGKFVGIVRCPDPHLSQFPNEIVPIRTVSLAGFGNGVPSGLFPFLRFELFDECSEMGGGTGVSRALYCSFRSRPITMRAARLSASSCKRLGHIVLPLQSAQPSSLRTLKSMRECRLGRCSSCAYLSLQQGSFDSGSESQEGRSRGVIGREVDASATAGARSIEGTLLVVTTARDLALCRSMLPKRRTGATLGDMQLRSDLLNAGTATRGA
jgi:hypothetical protein